jgi:hypothetical protein
MNNDRRSFLKMLGLGSLAAVAITNPVVAAIVDKAEENKIDLFEQKIKIYRYKKAFTLDEKFVRSKNGCVSQAYLDKRTCEWDMLLNFIGHQRGEFNAKQSLNSLYHHMFVYESKFEYEIIEDEIDLKSYIDEINYINTYTNPYKSSIKFK